MNRVPSDWRTWLPYGEAFRFVDEIRALDLPRYISTETSYRRHEVLINDHRVALDPIIPGVLLAEQAAQSAWLLGRLSGWLLPGARVLLGRINCAFERIAPFGEPVVAEVYGSVTTSDSAGFRATLSSSGMVIGKVVLAVRRFDA